MRYRRVALSLFLVFSFLAATSTFSRVMAVEYTVGCEKGDYVKYDCEGMGSGDQQLASIKLEVRKVLDEHQVRFKLTGTLENSSTVEFTHVVDVRPDEYSSPYIIAGGLEEGDPPFSGASINETTSKTYGGKTYTVNHISSDTVNMYYHKKTGLLLKGSGEGGTVEATESNLGASGFFGLTYPVLIGLAVGVLAVFGVIIYYVKKK